MMHEDLFFFLDADLGLSEARATDVAAARHQRLVLPVHVCVYVCVFVCVCVCVCAQVFLRRNTCASSSISPFISSIVVYCTTFCCKPDAYADVNPFPQDGPCNFLRRSTCLTQLILRALVGKIWSHAIPKCGPSEKLALHRLNLQLFNRILYLPNV